MPLGPCLSYSSPTPILSLATQHSGLMPTAFQRKPSGWLGSRLTRKLEGRRWASCWPLPSASVSTLTLSPADCRHVALGAMEPAPFLLPDVPGSSLIPSKTSLPGLHGIFQALLLWRWPCCYNPTCLDNQVRKGSGGKQSPVEAARLFPLLEEEPRGRNMIFCN